ncbi:uncharacterized protein LOC121995281 [Zingiber officinale]|uniref:Glabrous enhancer-binding protein-like DBD domain-containing protein n=1 Tax=Zingiber officinale TaxID=94328 RepID=A0A8J5GH40_ZINOF|nr:uncharacterized protein LOC121995281 [Zingiber officinale]KAG6501403.1 hypothetical protein ZIOFF_041283 [Zingiber officinale]
MARDRSPSSDGHKSRRKAKAARHAADSSISKGDRETLNPDSKPRDPSPVEKRSHRKGRISRNADDSSGSKGGRQTLSPDSKPRDPSPVEQRSRSKGKTTRYDGGSSGSKGERKSVNLDSAPPEPSPGQQKSSGKAGDPSGDDAAIVILRGAVDFRRLTGLLPTKSNLPAFYDSLKGKLHESLSQERVFNKYCRLRTKLSQAPSNSHVPNGGLLYELAAELWTKDHNTKDVKNVKKEQKTEKPIKDVQMEEKDDLEENEEKLDARQSYRYLIDAAEAHWKTYGLSSALLEASLKRLDSAKAEALQAKWKKHLEDEMKIEVDSHKIYGDIFAFLNATHKRMTS